MRGEGLVSGDFEPDVSGRIRVYQSWHKIGPIIIIITIIFIEMEFCSCCPGWSAITRSWLTTTSASQVQTILLPKSPKPPE